jgi:CRISPR-associated endonuclease/helicase Cas3
MLQAGLPDLAAYLAATHHGKVRLSIRSLPNEQPPEDDPGKLYARGIWDGDELPDVNLGGGVTAPRVRLKLDVMRLGRSPDGAPSWTERMVRLRDQSGPFKLAFLEALLRAADARASRKTQQGGTLDASRR